MTAILEAIISPERLGTYMKAVGHDRDRALAMYALNMKLSASFMPLFSSAEICLRNLAMARITAVYGPAWWQSPAFFAILGSRGKGIVKRAENQITHRGTPVGSGRMTAELSFGFWENMLLPKYQQDLWSPLHHTFTDLPAPVDQAQLYAKCGVIRELRNRISHHEPIFQRNISQDYADCLQLISWLSAAKAVWIKPQCDVMAVLRRKP